MRPTCSKKNGFSVVVNSDLQRLSTPEDQNAKIDFADVVARDWSRPDPDTPTSGPTPPSGGGGDGGGNVRPFDASGDGGTVRAAWETFNRLCSLNLEKVTECVRSGGYGWPEHAAARLCLDLVTAHVNGHLYWRHEYRAAYFAILALQRWAAVTAAA